MAAGLIAWLAQTVLAAGDMSSVCRSAQNDLLTIGVTAHSWRRLAVAGSADAASRSPIRQTRRMGPA
ncbi:hypothetical protein [Catellatospora sichuanensis]|uniref:hypothetical protein n=1 Tax=Catellatospora sichuanensis TaxID=1969805 RepID=UPI0011824215|nr:hypothetical protein [Catellatospora sichuanensis]